MQKSFDKKFVIFYIIAFELVAANFPYYDEKTFHRSQCVNKQS